MPVGSEIKLKHSLLSNISEVIQRRPRMHGIHHSIVKDETNSNYSVIFRWWDLLHRTLRLNVKQADVVIGVPAYTSRKITSF